MGIDLKTGFIGLATNVADLQAPPGALERANNVVIRRAGSVETRPGVRNGGLKSNLGRPMKLIPYETETVFANSGGEWWNYVDNIAIQYNPPNGGAAMSPALFRDDLIPHAQARGNLYIGTDLGVVKFTGVPDATTGVDMFSVAGVPIAFTIGVGAFGAGWMANNTQARYAAVGVKVDANNLTTRSRPQYALFSNTGGGAVNPRVSIGYAYPTRLFDYFEIYRGRTFPTTVTPDDELQLVAVLYAPSAIFVDTIVDASRGTTLYTSPSREGIEAANDTPPACGAMAVFKGALFCGNTIGPYQQAVSYTYSSTALSGVAAGIGLRTYGGLSAVGSNQITGMASTVGLERGMIVNAADFPSGTFITNIAGAVLTMSANALSVGVSFSFYDSLSWDGGTTWRALATISSGASVYPFYGDFSVVGYNILPAVVGYTNTFVIRSSRVDALRPSLLATHGGEYSPALPVYGGTPLLAPRDTDKNGLRWSNPDEPEHFPPKNFAFVGDKKREILALVSTRDALFIFKEDGIWRLTGANGQYRIDPFDLTTRCVLPSSVVPLRNKIYMLSNKGIVAVSDEGVEVVSRPIGDQLKYFVNELTINKPVDGGYYFDGYLGSAVGYAGAANERDHEYMLLVYNMMSNQASAIARGILVYNADTQAWTSWNFSETGTYAVRPHTLAWHDREGTLWIGQNGDPGRIKMLALPGDVSALSAPDDYKSDAEISINVTAGGATITYNPAIDMAVGDLVYTTSDNTVRTVIAIVSNVSVTLDSAAPISAGRYIRPITATLRPRAFIAPNQVQKQWTHFLAETTECVGVPSMTFSALSSVLVSTDALVATPMDIAKVLGVTQYKLGGAIRGWMPVQAARGWKLFAELAWQSAYGTCVIEALMVETKEGKTNSPNLAVGGP
jgi:hypothetical protein